jgi:hydrogenase expression/formation protein HypD
MEVCGTHTVAIFRSGLKSILPANVRLISGPGCPVCVTPNEYLDRAIALSRLDDVTLTTFGDMMRVPGTSSSLERERAAGRDIRVVYSTTDALEIARKNPDRRAVFLGVGFETTVPTIAVAIREAQRHGIGNFSVLCSHKLIPPALKLLAQSKDLKVDGFLLPGHVSTIIGTEAYEFLASEHRIPATVAGFEPLDLFQGVYLLLAQIAKGEARIENQYSRSVKPQGNTVALRLMEEVFERTDAAWRGIGVIPGSGLRIREQFGNHDAEKSIPVVLKESREPAGCLCGLVIQGRKLPSDCPLFAAQCTPRSPVGPCMVSSEGSCQAYYKYGRMTGRRG